MAKKKKSKRPTKVTREEVAVCFGCSWRDQEPGAQGRAARHYDETKHDVKATVQMVVGYGKFLYQAHK